MMFFPFGSLSSRTRIKTCQFQTGLTAAACASAGHAAVAASVADHDGSAGVAAGGVSHVVHAFHGVGGVVDAAIF